MNDLEQRLADGIREHGDRLFAGLPDWPNTSIVVGDEPLRIVAERIEEPRFPMVYRHQLRVPLAGLVRVQELVHPETLGDALLVDAEVLADRAEDGPVIGVTAIRHWYDKIGRKSFLLMRSPKGVPLICGWSTVGNAQRGSIARLRRYRRGWITLYENHGFDIDRLLLDPRSDWAALGEISHVWHLGERRVLGCEGREVFADAQKAGDGRWIAAQCGRLDTFRVGYEAGDLVPVGMSDDPDDIYLEGAFG